MIEYPRLALFLGGRWAGPENRDHEPVFNPASGEVLGEVPHATDADLDEALDAASRGFETWRRVSPVERGQVLQRAAALMLERREQLATLITLELGKPIAEARAEVEQAAGIFTWNAEEGRRAYGRVIPPRTPGLLQLAMREPLGPIAAFASWNAPLITPSRKISSALAAGCSVVLKASEETPAVALALAQILQDSGLPQGVLSVVFGDPKQISERLIGADLIRGITFTGSTAIGKQLAGLAVRGAKRLTLELGGHAPVVIFGDVDPDKVAQAAVAAKYRNAGQVCTSPTRFYVHRSIHDRFVERFAELAAAIKVGDGLDPATRMGPLANPRRLAAMGQIVDDARARRVDVRAGGEPIDGKGYFYRPTLLAGVDETSLVSNVEPFGPIAATSPFDSIDDAVRLCNRLPIGLASYVMTNDSRNAGVMTEAIAAGNVIVNHWQASLPETPFGGIRDSGMGLEGGIEGLQAFQTVKYVSQSTIPSY
ncbi:MAG: NAD-dependent succinate-semialdehyde dehydrogenase [Rhodopseudomonas palustris]|uniref:NAD-dependent succinate-semialdehyde dehydrogenase n=1 Tax=Rhodopseudomonas palustris TaxID=1076 RepID=A0A933VYE7_RHOPL|nr:NAD-dependent succinate-semialdehyde dehydrogenase [Rhodopseudomonas palustris]